MRNGLSGFFERSPTVFGTIRVAQDQYLVTSAESRVTGDVDQLLVSHDHAHPDILGEPSQLADR